MVNKSGIDTANINDLQSLFAAQPIFDSSNNRVAVELLYRSDSGISALELGDNRATTELLYNLCSGISSQIAQYNAPVFINVCADFLLSESFLPLDAENVVIELVERITPDPDFIAHVAAFKRRGFRFALDDFEFTPDWEPVIALADFIKVDVLQHNYAEIKLQMHRLRNYPLEWLAERVETPEQLEQCNALGFTLFQGYFLARPELVTGKTVPPAALKMADLINNLFRDEPDINKLSFQLNDEPALVMSMLRIANSPLYRKTREVNSVKELIMRLGLDLARKWILMFSVLNRCSPAAAGMVLSRAYTAQQLAILWHADNTRQSQFFLTGLLSGVDILFGIAPSEFVAQLNVADDIKNAICRQSGEAAKAVDIIKTIENAYAMKSKAVNINQDYFAIYNQQQHYVQDKFSGFGR